MFFSSSLGIRVLGQADEISVYNLGSSRCSSFPSFGEKRELGGLWYRQLIHAV